MKSVEDQIFLQNLSTEEKKGFGNLTGMGT
jgi:hypothetical protein